MYIADPIADLLARIKNAQEREKETVTVPSTNILIEILRIIKDRGFINDYEVIESQPQNQIKVELSYRGPNGHPSMTDFRRVSKPGVRVYRSYRDVKPVRNGMGVGIYSTSKGIKTDDQVVKEQIGGEYICEVW